MFFLERPSRQQRRQQSTRKEAIKRHALTLKIALLVLPAPHSVSDKSPPVLPSSRPNLSRV
jgi:hypothetical protein